MAAWWSGWVMSRGIGLQRLTSIFLHSGRQVRSSMTVIPPAKMRQSLVSIRRSRRNGEVRLTSPAGGDDGLLLSVNLDPPDIPLGVPSPIGPAPRRVPVASERPFAVAWGRRTTRPSGRRVSLDRSSSVSPYRYSQTSRQLVTPSSEPTRAASCSRVVPLSTSSGSM
jgi:hypothetical protein